jgi:hypothetical protein
MGQSSRAKNLIVMPSSTCPGPARLAYFVIGDTVTFKAIVVLDPTDSLI